MGWKRVPATRRPMARSSVGAVKILIRGAWERSGRLTCMPLRRRPASCSSTVTAGISGRRVRGWGRRRSSSAGLEAFSWSTVRAWLRAKEPARVRRREERWAPQPASWPSSWATERTYPPAETEMVKAAVSWLREVSWKSWMVMRAGFTGTSAPARASLWAGVPLIFFAEKMGGAGRCRRGISG